MKRTWIVAALAALMFVGGCRSCLAQDVTRRSVYDAVVQDLEVIAGDIETRAMDNAQSKYASAVARLEMETARAKDLLREKAKAESTDLLIYESWLKQAEAAHDNKLRELGEERKIYLERWGQRFLTLKKDAEAIKALKQHEKKVAEDRCRSGICGWVRQLTGRCGDNPNTIDLGGVKNLGTLSSIMLP